MQKVPDVVTEGREGGRERGREGEGERDWGIMCGNSRARLTECVFELSGVSIIQGKRMGSWPLKAIRGTGVFFGEYKCVCACVGVCPCV